MGVEEEEEHDVADDDIDHGPVRQDGGSDGDADEADIRVDDHHVIELALVGPDGEDPGQQAAEENQKDIEDARHGQGDEKDPVGEAYIACDGCGQNQAGVGEIDDDEGHVLAGDAVENACPLQAPADGDENGDDSHLLYDDE